MKSRLLMLFTLFVLLLPLMFQPTMATLKPEPSIASTAGSMTSRAAGSPVLPDESPTVPSPDYSDVGAARQIQEVANRTDSGQSVLLFYNSLTSQPINGSTSVVLASGWTGYKLAFSVSQLYENRCWVQNPSFNGNANNWNNGSYDNTANYVNTFSQSWQAGGVDGNGFVRVQENGYWDGSYYRYDINDRTWWRQTYTVNRTDLAWAGIRMDYRVNSAWGTTAFFNVYVRVNGTQVWAAGFPSAGDTNWHNTGFISVNTSLFTIPSKAIQVEVGIISIWTGGYSSNSWVRGDFDNVRLYMKTKVYPSDIKLKMNGLTVQNGPTRGLGSVTQVPARVWTSSPVVGQLNWTTVPRPPSPNLDVQVTGVCALNLFANKTTPSLYALSPSAVGTKFNAQSGQNTTWELYYLLNLPTQYSNDVFNITIPKDWNVTFVSEPQLPTVNKVGQCQGGHVGDGYLRVPSTVITVTPDGYWTIRAASHNYAHSAELQVWQNWLSSWSTTTAIRAGNTTRVRAQILDGSGNPPGGVALTQANVSIYQPGGSLWFTRLVTPTVEGWVYTSGFLNAGLNTTGGTYSIYVSWDNSTEAGEKAVSYAMLHSTGLTARESTIETIWDNKTLYPRVRYTDVDNNNWLEPPATVVGNWTTGSISFTYLVGTGYWQAEIDVFDAGDVGQFWILVNASKVSYDEAQCWILIDITAETSIASPQSGGVSIPWRDNATIQIHYTRTPEGAGINGCIPYVQVTANWTVGFYTISEAGNGWYNIVFNSTGPNSLGIFRLNVTISKERYQRQQFYVTVTVRNIRTDLRYTTPTNVYWGQNTIIPLFFNDTDHGGIAIHGASVICDWQDTYSFNGTYLLWLRTDNTLVGLHTVTINVSKSYYDTRMITVQFYVNPLALTVSATVADPIIVTYGDTFWVEVYVRTILGVPLTNARVTFSWTNGSFTNSSGPGGLYGAWFYAGVVGIHYVTAFVNRTNCAQTYFSIVLNVKQVPSLLDTVPPGLYQRTYVVGESFSVPVKYETSLHDPVQYAHVTFVVGGLSGNYTEVGSGVYNATIDTTGLLAGSYTIYVTASSPNVDSQSRAISLILTLRPAAIEPQVPVINIYWGDNFTVLVYFHNLFNDTPIPGANIAYFWGAYTGSLQPNGTAGWYRVSLLSTIFTAGSVYQVTLTANYPSFQFALATVTVNILAQPTTLTLVKAESRFGTGIITPLNLTGWTAPRGDVLWLYFNFTDGLNRTVMGATGAYSWALGSDVLQYEGGLYIAKINLTDVTPRIYFLTVTLSRQNFEISQLTQMQLNVIRIPTAISITVPIILASQDSMQLYTGEVVNLQIILNDTFHRLVIKSATVTLSIPALNVDQSHFIDNLDGSYSYPGISIAFEGTFALELQADAGILYAVAQRTITLIVTLNPVVVRAFQVGAIAAILGMILLGGWVAYTRVFSIPWLVRKMRGMTKTLGKGKTPRLSKREMGRIATRPDQMSGIVEPAYDGIGVTMPAAVVPVAISVQEREAEDETIWHELDQLEGLGRDQKLELFEEMKRIPATDRVWFLEDLKKQMVEGARFRRKPARAAVQAAAAPPAGPKDISPAMMRRLDAITALDPEEKQAVIRQLKGLSRAEQEDVIRALEEAER